MREGNWLQNTIKHSLPYQLKGLQRVQSVCYGTLGQPSLNGHFHKADTSLKRIARVGLCLSLLLVADSP